MNKLTQILREISIYNELFLFTNDSYSFVIELIKDWKIPMGYIVFNSGACIYNLSSQKKLFENYLSKNSARIISRFCLFNGLSFILHTSNNLSFTFGINYVNVSKYRSFAFKYKLLVFRYIKLKNWKSINEVLNKYPIYGIEILFDESIEKTREKKMNFVLNFFNNLEHDCNSFVTDSKIYFFSVKNKKIEAIKKIIPMSKSEIENHLIYFSMSFPDYDFASIAYFWFSDIDFMEWIESNNKENLRKPIYMPKGKISWIDWWRENDHLWKYNLMKLGWIFQKIKSIESEKIKELDKELKNNFLELNLKTGILNPKPLDDREKKWPIKKDIVEEKPSLFLLLWPDQISDICKYK